MKTSDPLSDLLARISNGLTAGHDKVDVPASRVKEAVLKVLEEEGFIASHTGMPPAPWRKRRGGPSSAWA